MTNYYIKYMLMYSLIKVKRVSKTHYIFRGIV